MDGTPASDRAWARAIGRVASAYVSVRPLVDALDSRIRVVPPQQICETFPELLDRISSRVGGPRLEVCRDDDVADLSLFERLVSEQLSRGFGTGCGSVIPTEADEIIDSVVRSSFEHQYGFPEI